MYSSTFIFAKGKWDEEFYRLDEAIAKAAKSTPGYLGEGGELKAADLGLEVALGLRGLAGGQQRGHGGLALGHRTETRWLSMVSSSCTSKISRVPVASWSWPPFSGDATSATWISNTQPACRTWC